MKIKSVPVEDVSLNRRVAFVKESKEGRSFSAVANTDVVDRDNEVVLPSCIYDRYLKNPLMLNIHNYYR